MPNDEIIAVSNIIDTDRIRGEMGDLNALAESIREYGIIQPIVLQRQVDSERPLLVAGGRRLAALRLLGTGNVRHGKEYIWRDEDISTSTGRIRLQAVELEENLKRQDLSWSEIALGKQKLLALMQELKGIGGPGRGRTDGFSQKSLASMLGENEATTSRDLELASYVTKFPALASLPTPADARRKIQVAVTVAAMQGLAKKKAADAAAAHAASGVTTPLPKTKLWELYHGLFEDNIANINDSSVDLVLSDLPYDIGLGGSTAAHGAGLGQFSDNNIDLGVLLPRVAVESYRILRPNRFAVFFYGMAYHQEFKDALTQAGFTVDDYPFIWKRNRTAPPSPSRYAKCYDPALIASKGSPTLLRPNLGNFLDITSVTGSDRLHAAQKPVEVMERFVLDMTTEGATIVDLMAGSGSTGVASVKNKRHCVLFELVEQNCLLIESRLGAL